MASAASLESLLSDVFDDLREGLREELNPAEYERQRRAFVFHMLDGKDDLERLTALMNDPSTKEADAATMLTGILCHIVPHLNVAAKLLLDDVRDPFARSAPGNPSAPPIRKSRNGAAKVSGKPKKRDL